MTTVNTFKIVFDVVINYEDRFWDDCIDNYRIMYWALDNIAIQVNPRERDNG